MLRYNFVYKKNEQILVDRNLLPVPVGSPPWICIRYYRRLINRVMKEVGEMLLI